MKIFKKDKKNKGFSLPELLVACALFVIIMTFSTYLLCSGMRYIKIIADRIEQLRGARLIMANLGEDLVIADEIMVFGVTGDDRIVALKTGFFKSDVVGNEVLCYVLKKRVDKDGLYKVFKQIYSPCQLADIAANTPKSEILLADRVKTCSVTKDGSIYTVKVQMGSNLPEGSDLQVTSKVYEKVKR